MRKGPKQLRHEDAQLLNTPKPWFCTAAASACQLSLGARTGSERGTGPSAFLPGSPPKHGSDAKDTLSWVHTVEEEKGILLLLDSGLFLSKEGLASTYMAEWCTPAVLQT